MADQSNAELIDELRSLQRRLAHAERDRRRTSRALEDTAARLQAAMASIPDPLITINAWGTVQSASNSVERVFGWTPDELVGQNIRHLMPEPYRSAHDGYLAEYRRTGQAAILGDTRELAGVRKDGSVFPCEITIWRADVPGQKEPLFCGIARDVSRRKRAEEALRANESRLRRLLETTGAVPWEASARTWQFTYVGPQAIDLLGYPRDRWYEHDFWAEHIHPEDRDDAVQFCVESSRLLEDFQVEYRMIASDGSVVWVHDIVNVTSANGEPQSLQGFMIDITDRKRAEDTLRESERRVRKQLAELENVYRTAPAGLCLLDTELRYVRINDALAATNGRPASEHIGLQLRDMIPQLAERVEPTCRSVIESGQPALDVEVHGTTPAEPGVEHDWLVSYHPVKDNEGTVFGVSVVVEDITDRKRANSLLRETHDRLEQRVAERTAELAKTNESLRSEIAERLRAEAALRIKDFAIASSTSAIVMADLNAKLTYVNDAFLRMWGYDCEQEVVGRRATEFTATEQDVYEAVAALRAGNSWVKETVAKRKDGSIFNVQSSAHMVTDEDQRPLCMMASLVDITERKMAEEALRKSEDRYRAFIEQSSEGIYRVEFDEPIPVDAPVETQIEMSLKHGYVAECNDAHARMYGYSHAGEFIGTRVCEFQLATDPGNIDVWNRAARNGYRLSNVETHEIDKEGRSKYFLNNQFAIVENGAVVRVWGIQRDITAQKKMEAALRESEKLAATGRMAARIAHEINNPLAAIKNSFMLIKDSVPEDHPSCEFVGLCQREIDRIARIVRQMYDLHRPEQAATREFCVNATVEDIARLLQATSHDHEVKLTVDVPEETTVLSLAEGSVRQVLFNIVQNAIEASPRGGAVTIAVSVEGQNMRISVSDQGNGIPAQSRARVFEPFYTTKGDAQQGGLGLGLSISRSLVDAIGGRLEFQSRSGEGTVFDIVLPRRSRAVELTNG